MPDETMPKPKSVEPVSVLLLPSPALLLAEGIAEAEAKAPRLRGQQGRVAKGKKVRLRAALRHLWGKIRDTEAYPVRITICLPCYTSLHSGKIYREAPTRQCECDCEFGDFVRQLSPKGQKSGG